MSYRLPRHRRRARRGGWRRPYRDIALVLSWMVMISIGSTVGAAALTGARTALGASRPVHDTRRTAAVGAIFHGAVSHSGNHFCSAGVVDSPEGNLLVTAAHCMGAGVGGLYFAPGYHDGKAPYGVWKLDHVTMDPRWTRGQDPDLDVAFATVTPPHGRSLQSTVGSYRLGTGLDATGPVRLTGYPAALDAPLTCVNRISAVSDSQLRISCAGYSGGTSGSPWVTADHVVMGVIGGYQRGGNTANVSYSPWFGDDIAELYEQAIAGV